MRKIITITIIFFGVWLTGCSSTGGTKEETSLQKAADINVKLGAAYLKQKDYTRSRTKLSKALEQDSDNPLAHSTIALLLEQVGEFEKAEDHFEEALDLAPKNSDIKNNYGTYLCNRGRYEEAQKMFHEAMNDPYYKTPIIAIINSGKCAMDNKQYKSSEQMLRLALRKDPRASTALYLMAELGIKTGRYLMTRAYIQRYHSIIKPAPATLWIQIQAERALGDMKVMRDLINQLNKTFPDSDEAGKAMGLIR